jgi:hypothetical protein
MYPGPYPVPVRNDNNQFLFNGMNALRLKMANAMERCRNISMSEKMTGYEESAKLYDEMSRELQEAKTWVEKELTSLLSIK